MNREDAEKYLRMLGQELQKQQVTGEILVHGDIKMLLDIRKPEIVDVDAYLTGDAEELENIDAYFGGHGVTLYQTAKSIAASEGLSEDWLYTALDTILSRQHEEWVEYPGIRVYPPQLEYLFTMEVVTADDLQKKKEIEILAKKLGISDSQGALFIIRRYIPNRLLTPKMRLIIKQCFGLTKKDRRE